VRLFLKHDDLVEWSNGAAGYFPDYPVGHNHILLVGMRCRFGELEEEQLALLDTASKWSFCRKEVADALCLNEADSLQDIVMSTRLGLIKGFLAKVGIRLVSEFGEDLILKPTFFISSEWDGPNVLGWKTCIESIRLAIDPSQNMLFFGNYGRT
jgi:hypothetical protein